MPAEAFDWSLEVGAEKAAWSDMMLIRFPISTATVVRKKHKEDRIMITPISQDTLPI